jgi:hypothetical protein
MGSAVAPIPMGLPATQGPRKNRRFEKSIIRIKSKKMAIRMKGKQMAIRIKGNKMAITSEEILQ